MIRLQLFIVMLLFLTAGPVTGQESAGEESRGPIRDATYHVLWLIESDDANRVPYTGPARDGLTAAGYGRLVPAGAATAAVTIGQRSTVSGKSRYGHMSVSVSMLNTTEQDQLQVEVDLQTEHQTPVSIGTMVRVPLGRWFLLGAAESRAGLPKHADDGKRGVAIMKIDNGVMLLD